jgi:hypothetical protein
VETTERIVEAYVRYVRGWATIPNLRCDGQKEIDLFAIDPVTDERWHIETSVSISSGFSALTNEPFEPGEHKQRAKAAAARRKLGFFLAEKFQPVAVEQRLSCLGCAPGKLRRAIVTWDWKAGVGEAAAAANIELWSLPALMNEIAKKAREGRAYFADDILRTIDLYARGLEAEAKRDQAAQRLRAGAFGLANAIAVKASAQGNTRAFYVYENWTNKRARLHRADCSHCNDGRGSQVGSGEKNGRWHGPFCSIEEARGQLGDLTYHDKAECRACL